MVLVDEIKEIQKAEKLLGVSTEKVKGLIEEYRPHNPSLEKAIQNPEESIQGGYQSLISKCEGIRSFLLPRWFTKKETKIPKENKELVDDRNLTSKINAGTLGYAGMGAGAIYVIAFSVVGYLGLTEPSSTHQILESLLTFHTVEAGQICLGVYGGVGALLGVCQRFSIKTHKNDLKKDLKFLDDQIEEVYHKK